MSLVCTWIIIITSEKSPNCHEWNNSKCAKKLSGSASIMCLLCFQSNVEVLLSYFPCPYPRCVRLFPLPNVSHLCPIVKLSLMYLTLCSIPPVPGCLVFLATIPLYSPCKPPCVRSVFHVLITEFVLFLSVLHIIQIPGETFIIKMTTNLESSLCVSASLDPPDLVPDGCKVLLIHHHMRSPWIFLHCPLTINSLLGGHQNKNWIAFAS